MSSQDGHFPTKKTSKGSQLVGGYRPGVLGRGLYLEDHPRTWIRGKPTMVISPLNGLIPLINGINGL